MNNSSLQANETALLLPQNISVSNGDISSRFNLREFNKENLIIIKRTLPVVFAYVLQQTIPMVSLFSLGHMVIFFQIVSSNFLIFL
jgi:hypothetical protein